MTISVLRALIFDLDGVVVNTVDLHYRAWKQVFDDIGVAFSREDMDRFRGIYRRDILLRLVDGLSEAQISDLLTRKDNFYKQFLHEVREDILHVPIVNLLKDAKARGLKIGLASSSVNAHLVLEIVRLGQLFDAVADGNTVCRSKPAPDIFVWTAGALNVSPNEVAVVEDSTAGVEAALTAGMFVVGIDIHETSFPSHLNLSMDQLHFTEIAAAYERFAQSTLLSNDSHLAQSNQ